MRRVTNVLQPVLNWGLNKFPLIEGLFYAPACLRDLDPSEISILGAAFNACSFPSTCLCHAGMHLLKVRLAMDATNGVPPYVMPA
jgi:hypothetical protein